MHFHIDHRLYFIPAAWPHLQQPYMRCKNIYKEFMLLFERLCSNLQAEKLIKLKRKPGDNIIRLKPERCELTWREDSACVQGSAPMFQGLAWFLNFRVPFGDCGIMNTQSDV